ncbi:DUF4301 family protein [Ekhidna sp.]|uniref:DUF4301 family protein n=1 Tax=Ekhidna sp. TaxID=2608089 RepID=UPI003510DAE2
MFSDSDIEQIKKRGITLQKVDQQLDRFRKGFPHIHLTRSATIGDGIIKLSQEEVDHYVEAYDDRKDLDVIKFVPASGAATRMFKPLFQFLEHFDGSNFDFITREEKKVGKFFTELDEFAFYGELSSEIIKRENRQVGEVLNGGGYKLIVETLLGQTGLNYGQLPKGLLKFHEYEEGPRTPAHEHLVEAKAYAHKQGKIKVHFTVSPEHLEAFKSHVDGILGENDNFKVGYSTQLPETDTIASKPDFSPFRLDNGSLLFRPAGHGALLENLNQISTDIIFIKNIDNVVPDRIKKETIRYKKALAGVLITYQSKIFSLLSQLESGADVYDEARGLLEDLGYKGDFSNQKVEELLNRPIRVCGMVKNEGEPGGGPFWVASGSDQTLQIVESAQVDKDDKSQKSIFKTGTHFNPVDLVCGIKNYKGEKFDLLKYRDDETGFISEKSHNGQKLLAMELPGLWNGSMANWNTIFVEVPLITFNPVKTVTDLLKPTHR